MREAKHPFKYSEETSELIGKKVKQVIFSHGGLFIVTEDMQLFRFSVYVHDYEGDIEFAKTYYSDISYNLDAFLNAGLISPEEYHSLIDEHMRNSKEQSRTYAEEEKKRRLQAVS